MKLSQPIKEVKPVNIWTDVPYELQSPGWRSALNEADTGRKGWNPSLNANKAADFLTAFQATQTPETNTVSANGQTGFINALKDVGVGLLTQLGARDNADSSMQAQPVAFQSSSAGLDNSTLLLIAGGAVAVYLLTQN